MASEALAIALAGAPEAEAATSLRIATAVNDVDLGIWSIGMLVFTSTVEYTTIAPAFVMAGVGMGLFVTPIANVVLSAVRPEEEGQASGATNAIRELGAVFGVAVLAAVFAASGSYASPAGFVDGLVPALQFGAVAVAIGAVAALALPGRVRTAVIAAPLGTAEASVTA